MTPCADAIRLKQRAGELAAQFVMIEATRMRGVPVLNPALRVEAVGFEALAGDEAETAVALGILITPWFMNLVRLPLHRDADTAMVGCKQTHVLHGRHCEFIGAHEPAIGTFSACSLFSPMFEFGEQAEARATALQVLAQLRCASPKPKAATAASNGAAPPSARRAFLFGRGACGSTP